MSFNNTIFFVCFSTQSRASITNIVNRGSGAVSQPLTKVYFDNYKVDQTAYLLLRVAYRLICTTSHTPTLSTFLQEMLPLVFRP